MLPPGSWRERLAGLLAGAGRQGAAAAVVALLALAGAGVLWARGAPRAGPPAGLPGPAAPAGGGAAAGPGGAPLPSVAPGGTGAQGPAGGVVTVDVVGRVRRSGVVRLPAGSRVLDAVQAAGGTTAGADLDALNLARKVVDGEQVRVPAHGERPPPPSGGPGALPAAGAPPAPVDLNTATVEQLDALPGVGQVTADRIVASRTAHPFASVVGRPTMPSLSPACWPGPDPFRSTRWAGPRQSRDSSLLSDGPMS